MFKVLIVEDERRTARSIAQLVNEHPDFHVEDLAANGAEALICLSKNVADLVITDIRMPAMDGMQLLKVLHTQYPQCLSIVLSGYSEFEYARTALQYNAFNYLLKPLDQDDLFQVLDSVKKVLTERRQAEYRVLIQRALDGTSIPENPARFYLMLVHSGQSLSSLSLRPEQLAKLQQCFRDSPYSISGTHDTERILAIPASPAVKEQARQYFQLLRQRVQTPVQLICTETPVSLSELQSTVKQLRSILEHHAQLFRSDFFTADATQPQSLRSGTPLRDLHPDQAAEAVCTQNRDALRQCLTQMLNTSTRRADVQNYLFTVIRDPRLSYQLAPGRLDLLKTRLTEIITAATEPEACVEQLTAQLLDLQSASENKRDLAELAEEIAQYLNTNYHMPLSIDMLAKQYGIGPRHLNKVFKQHKGVRPSEYLLTLRIDRAKRILETKPDAMVKDVANSVGYSDPLYFSRTFKKETGLWPTEYQQQHKK